MLFIQAIDTALANKITYPSPSNPLISAVLHGLDNGKSLFARASKHDWQYDNRKLYFENWLYIPKPSYHDLVSAVHTSETCGYSGVFHILNLLQQDY